MSTHGKDVDGKLFYRINFQKDRGEVLNVDSTILVDFTVSYETDQKDNLRGSYRTNKEQEQLPYRVRHVKESDHPTRV